MCADRVATPEHAIDARRELLGLAIRQPVKIDDVGGQRGIQVDTFDEIGRSFRVLLEKLTQVVLGHIGTDAGEVDPLTKS